ncbi:MAG: 50S ribosomal protein L28 [Elusimicrobia bacterium]|nr:50S ribosomal protein L28 [Candidatus Obscuribacterium magneticum]
MSKRCELTGVGPSTGNTVSHSNRHIRRRWLPNLRKKRIYLADEDRWVSVRVTANVLKTLTKKGMASVLKMKARVARAH